MPSTSRSLRAWLWRVKGRVQKYEVGLWFRKKRRKRGLEAGQIDKWVRIDCQGGQYGLQVSR